VSGYTSYWDVYVKVTTHDTTTTELVHGSAEVSGSSREYVLQGLQLNFETDTFKLVARNSYGASPATEVDMTMEALPDAPAPSAAAGDKQVQISWLYNNSYDARSGIGPINGYTVWQGTSPGKEDTRPVPSARVSVTTTPANDDSTLVTLTVSALDSNQEYYFKVAQSDAAGPSKTSAEVSATSG
jgi:hypothetical protein